MEGNCLKINSREAFLLWHNGISAGSAATSIHRPGRWVKNPVWIVAAARIPYLARELSHGPGWQKNQKTKTNPPRPKQPSKTIHEKGCLLSTLWREHADCELCPLQIHCHVGDTAQCIFGAVTSPAKGKDGGACGAGRG